MSHPRARALQPVLTKSIIQSRNNPKIKQIRALLRRAERTRTGMALVEGRRLVIEALRFPDRVRQVIVAPELLSNQQGYDLLHSQALVGVPLVAVSPEAFESFSQKDSPQGIAAVITQRWEPLDQVRLSAGSMWVALEAIQDPGNLGTILRTCDATGCHGVFLLDHTTDPYDPVALRASMGAIFSQRLVKASFADFARWKARHRYALIGTSDAAALHYRHVAYPSPVVILMGSERQGLLPEHQTTCDLMVRIPMRGSCDSLNIAVATAVVLYEVLDQRGQHAGK
ncbi:MAG TPA: RNA methyltransferase [Ktedonobacteraceae bacterium]|jgi:TrmH family RNA methyltransferase|nr:RNA methyltransferase [Ktedonobacteraceae bacterium]